MDALIQRLQSPRSSSAHRVDHSQLQHSVNRMKRAAAGVGAPGPGHVVVTDGTGHQTTFGSITSALDSITNAGPGNEYFVAIGPGVFNESVTLKPYVHLKGAGPTQTIIQGPGNGTSTVQAAPNSSVQMCGIEAHGAPPGGTLFAVYVTASLSFMLTDCNILADDTGGGESAVVFGVNVDWPNGGGSTVAVNDCAVIVSVTQPGSAATGVIVTQGSNLQVFTSKVMASSGSGISAAAYGGISSIDAALECDWCTVSGTSNSLVVDGPGATCVARACTLVGPTSGNVQIIPDPA